MTAVLEQQRLTANEARRIIARMVQERAYREFGVGAEISQYLYAKRKRLTPASFLVYEATLDKLARDLIGLELSDLEPPVGTQRLEEFLGERWGDLAPATYNKAHAIVKDFTKWAQLTGRLHGDPMLAVTRARARDVYRETFTPDQVRAIIAAQDSTRDRIAVRLLLDYGLRKGSLRAIQFKHFDHVARRLTVFSKGGKVRTLPIPSRLFWNDLERLILDVEAQPNDFLMWRYKFVPGNRSLKRMPGKPLGHEGAHKWWYRCLEKAGVVATGTTSGERMHKARHTAGQRLLNATGNLKAVQKLLGHASIQTTADSYVDWDLEQLAADMRRLLSDEEDQ